MNGCGLGWLQWLGLATYLTLAICVVWLAICGYWAARGDYYDEQEPR